MRPLTLITVLLGLICFSSCAPSWQYITLDSHEVTKDTSKRFTWENDTLSLMYNYNGYGGPVWLSITNKTDKPMYVNWKKSAIINLGYSRSLYQPNVKMAGSFDAVRVYGETAGRLAGSFSVPEGMDFIPPHSNISKTLDLTIFRTAVNKDQLKGDPQTLRGAKTVPPTIYQMYTYDQLSSPVQFKSYLTFVFDTDNAKEFAVSHAFYGREIMMTKKSPWAFSVYKDEGDILYITQNKK